jgi:hypothetical protein
MTILIITDYPESKSFTSIIKLRNDLKQKEKVKEIYIESSVPFKKEIYTINFSRDISTVIISLVSHNLQKFIQYMLLDELAQLSHIKHIFLFGSRKILDKYQHKKVNKYYRRGVSKISSQLKSDILALY